jgi:transposase
LPAINGLIAGREPGVLVELGVVEQRYRAVLEVLDEGATVTDVARRYGVARQTVHGWLRRYANEGGLGALADRSPKPDSCPHQMAPEVEARIFGLRRAHPSWGPSRLRWQLEQQGVDPLPGRSRPGDGAVADGRDGPGVPR